MVGLYSFTLADSNNLRWLRMLSSCVRLFSFEKHLLTHVGNTFPWSDNELNLYIITVSATEARSDATQSVCCSRSVHYSLL